MDRRTLLFVIALTLALFGINIFFENQRQENLREWNEQNKAQKSLKQKKLEEELAAHTAKAVDLPLIDIFTDPEAKQFLAAGIDADTSILTLSWSHEIPQTVYAKRKNSTEPPERFQLNFLPEGLGDPVLYQKGAPVPLKIGNLPEFGNLYLQLVILTANRESPYEIALGRYVDGHFSIPALEDSSRKIAQNAIALLNTVEGYLPVAVYNAHEKRLHYLDEMQGLKTLLVTIKKEAGDVERADEKFYVLESPYQQLVFSNYGGALAEINLPFAGQANKKSVVREIPFDREMIENHPQNAHFPAHPYYLPEKEGEPKEHPQGVIGGYYPLLRRDLIESGNRKSIRIQPQYYAFNIVSEYPEVAQLVYQVTHFDQNSIVFEAKQSHRRITKTYTLKAEEQQAPYSFDLTVKIEGDSRGLWLTTGIPEVEWISGAPAPALKYRITRNEKADVENIDLPTDSLTVTSVYPDWICNSNGFLGVILDSLAQVDPGYRAQYVSGNVVPSRLVLIEEEYDRFKAKEMPGYLMMLPLKSSGGTMNFRIFSGPFSDSVLKTVDQIYADPEKGYNPDYIACQTYHGWFTFISQPFAKFLFILMKMFYSVTGSWALSIILLTVALRIMMYPLNAWSSKSMIAMQQIGPEVAAIQEKYKKDPKKAQIEVMNLYRERGVNPMSGCLPMLIQMPFLIGMFDLLKSTFELRGASFIPGWIDDLASPDVLFRWKTPIFFIGNEFHLLPIILGAVMLLQQRLSSPQPKDPHELTDQQRQQRAMGSIMSVVFAFMFYNFPSGLNIYWLSSMLLGILQQWWTARRMQPAAQKGNVSKKT